MAEVQYGQIAKHEHSMSLTRAAGVRLERATVAQSVLGKVDNLYLTISSLSVRLLDISLPTWSRPLTIVLHGVTVELMQRNVPKVMPSFEPGMMVNLLSDIASLTAILVQYCELTALAAVEQAVTHEINTAKLLAVEKLLWGHKPRKPGEGKQGKYHAH